MKILVLSSYAGKQKYNPDNRIRSEDLEPPARLEGRIQELSDYSAPAGDMFTGPLHTQLRQGLKQIRKHEQYGENTLDLYFPGYHYRVDQKKIPVSENDPIVPFDILPPKKTDDLEDYETGFLESMGTLIESYDLVLSILRWQDIVRLQSIFEVERTATVIFLIAPNHKHVVNEDLPNLHVVETDSDLRGNLHTTNWAMKGVVLRRLCEAACHDGFHVFEQVKQDPQRLLEIARSLTC